MKRLFPGLAALAISTSGCTGNSAPNQADGRLISIPPGYYTSVAWVDPNTIFLTTVPDVDLPGSELWFVEIGNNPQLAQMPIDDPRCGRVDVRRVQRLSDDRVGFLEFCLRDPAAGFPNPDRIFVAAVDPRTGRLERLMDQPLGFNSHQFTWNPELTRGFASTLSDLCGSFLSLSPTGPSNAAIGVTESGFTWELDDYFADGGRHCERYGRADWPAWSPDGDSVAFFASAPRPAGTSFEQAAAPWSLFAMSAEDLQPERLLGGILHPHGLGWSDDGRLAFSGGRIGQRDGFWIFDPGSRELMKISDKSLTSLAWSPDGDEIAGIYQPDPRSSPPEGVLLIFDSR